MLTRICLTERPEDQALKVYQNFMVEIVFKIDIEEQETCHMLQKLPLVVCNHQFISLNVGKIVFHHLRKKIVVVRYNQTTYNPKCNAHLI